MNIINNYKKLRIKVLKMAGKADFSKRSWEEGGTLVAIDAEADDQGRLIPKVRVINPGWNDRKSTGYMYMIIYGIIEDRDKGKEKSISSARPRSVQDPDQQGGVSGSQSSNRESTIIYKSSRAFGSFPIGVGKCSSDPEDLLEAILKLDITVRRTAGSSEKLVYGVSNVPASLTPWNGVLANGAIFPAIKVCSNVDIVPVDRALKLRPIFLTITLLTDAGVYKVPSNVLDFRMNNAISFNLLVTLQVGSDFQSSGVKGVVTEDGERVTTLMVHIGNFARKKGKAYSVDYCRRKVEKMDLRFSLGAIGGLSLHIRVAGKMSNVLRAQLGYRKSICYSLMDTNPYLNRVMWKSECSIKNVTAVFQPSVPKEFKIYENILIDNTGKILKQ
ncbi:matrix protein [Wufeng Myotis altarium paramyxovirus 1]|uniref:Matrix protein n=1 Tax=Wufeng Myotis altarium paramyxovirus 1 TaxID=2928981 RepID=A0A8T9KM46_9MONO|nr:matrix protein [Wufeng Myotis altarium paramyxovirus 1]